MKIKHLLPFLLLLASPPLLWLQSRNCIAVENQVSDADGLTFGSPTVLAHCWTEAELQGTSSEKNSRPLRTSSKQPPVSPASCRHMLPPVPLELQKSIRAVRPKDGSKVIALTFDLCEGPGEIAGYDADVVNFLRTAAIKATFFAGGKWLQSHPDRAMQLIADPLFEIGNHSWNHPNFRLLAEAANAGPDSSHPGAIRTALAKIGRQSPGPGPAGLRNG